MRNKAKYLECLNKALSSFYPVTQKNLILYLQSQIDDSDTILDVGCGCKWITKHLICYKLTGIDIWADYLSYMDICGDVRNIRNYFDDKSFDIITAIDLIEHFDKDEGIALLKNLDYLANKKIFVTTPTTWVTNEEAVTNRNFWTYGNEYNYHKSFWTAEDFIKLGYKIAKVDFCSELILAEKEIK